MRRREAEARCADAGGEVDLVVLDVDRAHEARTFEIVARAVEQLTPRLEVVDPGRLLFATRGPSRYFGGDVALQAEVMRVIRNSMPIIDVDDVHVGIGDGRFVARLAARRNDVVAPDAGAEYIAPFPVAALGDADLASTLERLGLVTLGAFAALERSAVLARFGTHGARLWSLATGVDPEPLQLSVVPQDCAASLELDPPVDRVDAVAFSAKSLADHIVGELAARGLACTRVLVEAETEHGERFARSWRHDEGFQPAALAERVRWQLDGWLHAAAPRIDVGDVRTYQDIVTMGEVGLDSTTGALTRLRLEPEEVVAIPARQLGMFGGDPAAAQRADRVLCRVQGMLGYEAVTTMVEQGGRVPSELIALVPWGEPRMGERPLIDQGEVVGWPGAIPAPYPTRVFDPGVSARLLDVDGRPLRVNARGLAHGEPYELRSELLPSGGGRVIAWEGPWPSDVRWWDGSHHQRCVRWRLTMDAGVVVLVATRGNTEMVEAIYD